MIVTTMFLASLILALLYLVWIRRVAPLLGYAGVVGVGSLCLLGGSVHFIYVGVETIAFGILVVWAHNRWGRKLANESRTQA